MGQTQVLYIYVTVVYPSILVGLLTVGTRAVPKALADYWEPSLLLACLPTLKKGEEVSGTIT